MPSLTSDVVDSIIYGTHPSLFPKQRESKRKILPFLLVLWSNDIFSATLKPEKTEVRTILN